jgi:hypothetical protein
MTILATLSARLLGLLLDPRIIGVVAFSLLLFAGWSHYTGLKSDLATARIETAAATSRAIAAKKLANDNAAELARAQEQHRAAIAALEDANARLAASAHASREVEGAVRVAPESHDGPVAPLLGRNTTTVRLP